MISVMLVATKRGSLKVAVDEAAVVMARILESQCRDREFLFFCFYTSLCLRRIFSLYVSSHVYIGGLCIAP